MDDIDESNFFIIFIRDCSKVGVIMIVQHGVPVEMIRSSYRGWPRSLWNPDYADELTNLVEIVSPSWPM